MKKKLKKILTCLILCTLGCTCAVTASAHRGGLTISPAPEEAPDSVLYYGSVKAILTDDEGNASALQMFSDRYGEYVMNLSGETIWVDCAAMGASSPSDLREDEYLYVFHSPASTCSLPPQSAAIAVVRNIPMDMGSAMYMIVSSVEEADGITTVAADHGKTRFTVDADTTYAPYLTRNMVRLSDITEGTRIMVWYDGNPMLTSRRAAHIMILPAQDTDITRGEFVNLLYEHAGTPVVDNHPGLYSDVKAGMKHYASILWATKNNITQGYDNQLFGADDLLTLEQAVTMLWRAAHSPMLMDYPGLTAYADADQISSYAGQALAWAHQKGFLPESKDGLLCPQDPVRTSEAEALLARVFAEN